MTGRNLNESSKPRVLVVGVFHEHERERLKAALEQIAPTVQFVENWSEVQAAEWDVAVTPGVVGQQWQLEGRVRRERVVPPNLQVIALISADSPVGIFDWIEDESASTGGTVFLASARGHAAVLPDHLDDGAAQLVTSQLVGLVAGRDSQFGVRPGRAPRNSADSGRLQPLLLGPEGLAYAASYQRSPGSEVWVFPDDLPDYLPWFRLAFDSWAKRDPKTFATAGEDWRSSPRWRTAAELEVDGALEAERKAFQTLEDEHRSRVEGLEHDAAQARAHAAATSRRLLTSQGDDLQVQVQASLIELGFDVADMDAVWDERERREDFRITDSADPEWLVIADATGSSKGVKGTKLMLLERYITKYALEEKPSELPGFWLIANQFLDRAPDARPNGLLRGDELAVTRDAGGLVLDTVALFLLAEECKLHVERKADCRVVLRQSFGEFTRTDAAAWIAG